jgi:phage-related holin
MPPYIYHVISPVTDPKAQTAIFTVLALILLDLVVGIVGAVVTHTFSSEKMRAGLLHKFMELCAMALGAILDGALVGGFDLATQPLLIATCVYIGIMETGSVLELIKKYDPDAEGLVGWITSFVSPKGGE